MAYHEEHPWRDRRRTHRVRPTTALGCLLALGFVIVMAVIEFRAAAIIVGLAVVTAVLLFISRRADRRSR
ncbi:hypothetical protein QF035_005188 [Streptomyces umbrinus]|uniref:Uncharacterized protein n=1 Tax=Streptomyces umbrinus TaxID=67370 RepID=A0ABU0SVP7_9ACTN|nr:hypothetical protein [Streptomyces umbrinus]